MLIAGEASGDLLAAELVRALKNSDAVQARPFPPQFFGAGGPRMAAEGVELAIDMTPHAVTGLSDVLKRITEFKRILDQLVELAIQRQPDVIICVDFSGFNHRFAHVIRKQVQSRSGPFNNWNPKIVQYVSPQVWASRPGRANQMARDFDLLLSIFPFEKKWYAQREPTLRVEFVGHPLVDRYSSADCGLPITESTEGRSHLDRGNAEPAPTHPPAGSPGHPRVLLLPGSRVGELNRHLSPMLKAAWLIQQKMPARFRLVLPNEQLAERVRHQLADANRPARLDRGSRHLSPVSTCLSEADIQVGHLGEALAQADLAIASTGTVTMECACFGVPTVAIYRTSWSNYLIARNIITVKHLAMPNLLANDEIFPEFLQHAASADNIARAALELLSDPHRRSAVKTKLASVIQSLGGPGASGRAARTILELPQR